MWELLTGEEPYANMHYGAIIGLKLSPHLSADVSLLLINVLFIAESVVDDGNELYLINFRSSSCYFILLTWCF